MLLLCKKRDFHYKTLCPIIIRLWKVTYHCYVRELVVVPVSTWGVFVTWAGVNWYMCKLLCYYVITVFIIRQQKLDVSSVMEYELQCGCCGTCVLCYRAFPLTLSRSLSVSLGLSRSSSQGGSLQEQQAGRALSHRGATQECIVCVRKTGQLGQNSATSSLNVSSRRGKRVIFAVAWTGDRNEP